MPPLALAAVDQKTESHPHLELVLRLWDAIAEGDVVALGRLVAPKATWSVPGDSPVAGTYWGADGLQAFLASIGDLAEGSVALREVSVGARGAVVRCHVAARRGVREITGEPVVQLRIRDGRIQGGCFNGMDRVRYQQILAG
jgi:ketosteroid isomerase-like protein